MSEQSKFLLYTAPDGAVKVDVFFKEETVWLTQKALAELFAVKVPAINKHLKNIFESGELNREATISKMEIVRPEGGSRLQLFPFWKQLKPTGKTTRLATTTSVRSLPSTRFPNMRSCSSYLVARSSVLPASFYDLKEVMP